MWFEFQIIISMLCRFAYFGEVYNFPNHYCRCFSCGFSYGFSSIFPPSPKVLDPTWISCTMRPTRRPWTQVIYPASRRPKKVPINRLEAAMALGRSKKRGHRIFRRTWRYVEDFKQKRHLKKKTQTKKGFQPPMGVSRTKMGIFTSKSED